MILLVLIFLSILSELSECCEICSDNKNEDDCNLGWLWRRSAPCLWQNSQCVAAVTECSAITDQKQCKIWSNKNLHCAWEEGTCQDVKACSSYTSDSDCYLKGYNCDYQNNTCIDQTETTLPISNTPYTPCEKQNTKWCDNSSTYDNVCYLSSYSSGKCRSVSSTTQCPSRDQEACSKLWGCSWNTSSGCKETNCLSSKYSCDNYRQFNGDYQLCQLLNNLCEPVTVAQLSYEKCQGPDQTWNEKTGICEYCPEALDTLFPPKFTLSTGKTLNNTIFEYHNYDTFSYNLLRVFYTAMIIVFLFN